MDLAICTLISVPFASMAMNKKNPQLQITGTSTHHQPGKKKFAYDSQKLITPTQPRRRQRALSTPPKPSPTNKERKLMQGKLGSVYCRNKTISDLLGYLGCSYNTQLISSKQLYTVLNGYRQLLSLEEDIKIFHSELKNTANYFMTFDELKSSLYSTVKSSKLPKKSQLKTKSKKAEKTDKIRHRKKQASVHFLEKLNRETSNGLQSLFEGKTKVEKKRVLDFYEKNKENFKVFYHRRHSFRRKLTNKQKPTTISLQEINNLVFNSNLYSPEFKEHLKLELQKQNNS